MHLKEPQVLSAVLGSVVGGLARPDNLPMLRMVLKRWADDDDIWVKLGNVAQQNQLMEDMANAAFTGKKP
jgi:hypothetical protein